MNTVLKMKRLIFGIMYCALWYVSILVGFFLFICPLLPLVFLHPKLYRKCSETVFGMWEPFPVALMEIFFGIRAVLSGDQIDPFERSLLIMNHRTRLDWNFLWIGLFHCCHPYSHALKYVLKAALMYFPGPGWVMQTCSFLFVYRKWEKDQILLERLVNYLDVSDYPYQILIFPEGTDLTPENILKSHKYADEHNLERYYNVLHPRTTGFAFIVHKMQLSGKINAVYDITVGYPGGAPQNESDLLKGNFPKEVHFHVKRHRAWEIPAAEPELKLWLNEVWRKKERLLTKFQEFGSFTHFVNVVKENDEEIFVKSNVNEASSTNSIVSEGTIRNRKYLENMLERTSNEINKKKYEASYDSHFSVLEHQDERVHEEIPLNKNYKRITECYPTSSAVETNEILSDETSSSYKEIFRRTINYSNNSFINKYRPSHLLYLTFIFWMAIIYFTTHQLFVNFYVQIWVLAHSILFSFISFLTNGFQHIIASIYFYRYNIKTTADQKINKS